jgi:hypothetical protein
VLTAKIDRPKLEASLKRAAKAFGETSAQSVVRWGVSVCRDLAVQTQAFGSNRFGGKGKKSRPSQSGSGNNHVDTSFAKGLQEGAIVSDAFNVIMIVPAVGPKNKKGLRTPGEVNDWIEMNRTRRRARTAKLAIEDRKVCTEAVFKAAMKIRFKNAGMAKGGWLGAGMVIARMQSGTERINIGKNFLSYAQKHSNYGTAKPPMNGYSPTAEMFNRVRHSGARTVLSDKAKNAAIEWGLRKTLTWYKKATKQALDKV